MAGMMGVRRVNAVNPSSLCGESDFSGCLLEQRIDPVILSKVGAGATSLM
jgi:hypothetical protein